MGRPNFFKERVQHSTLQSAQIIKEWEGDSYVGEEITFSFNNQRGVIFWEFEESHICTVKSVDLKDNLKDHIVGEDNTEDSLGIDHTSRESYESTVREEKKTEGSVSTEPTEFFNKKFKETERLQKDRNLISEINQDYDYEGWFSFSGEINREKYFMRVLTAMGMVF